MIKNAVVVGSGIGGISVAIRLALKGYNTIVLEKNTYPGGKLSEIHLDNYRFDAGPSLFTLPTMVEELFNLAGYHIEDYFQYKRLDIICKYFYGDGTVLRAFKDKEKFAQELEKKLNEPKNNVLKFLKKCKTIYELTAPVFIFRSFHKAGTFFSVEFIKALTGFYKLNVFQTMHNANKSSFRNPKTVQLFDRYATYNGSNPYKAPATLNVIAHLEHNLGAYFPLRGMFSITDALVTLAKNLGIKFIYKSNVTRILHKNGKISGVETTEKFYPADLVVNDSDIRKAYELLPELKLSEKYKKQEASSSALIFYWGIKSQWKQLDVHNIFFSSDYRAEFDHLFKQKLIYNDPTVYIYISSKLNKYDAPPDCENWFVMINVPENIGQDWDLLIEKARSNILIKISGILKTDITPYIEKESILDPRSIESKTSSFRGSLYGSSSNTVFSAFTRHPNFLKKIKGLYFVGGSVHPGGGIPLCMASAKIVSEMVK